MLCLNSLILSTLVIFSISYNFYIYAGVGHILLFYHLSLIIFHAPIHVWNLDLYFIFISRIYMYDVCLTFWSVDDSHSISLIYPHPKLFVPSKIYDIDLLELNFPVFLKSSS